MYSVVYKDLAELDYFLYLIHGNSIPPNKTVGEWDSPLQFWDEEIRSGFLFKIYFTTEDNINIMA